MINRSILVGILLLAVQSVAHATGAPGVGWVTIAVEKSPVPNLGPVTITVNGFTATYKPTLSDTSATVAAGLATALNDPSSPVTAFATGAVITLTSKAVGTASNYSLAAGFTAGSVFTATASGNTLLGGTDLLRNFRMLASNDLNGGDGDLSFSFLPPNAACASGYPQPPGRSVLLITGNLWDPQLFGPPPPAVCPLNGPLQSFDQQWPFIAPHYDFARIDAVYVDEPYAQALLQAGQSLNGNPCQDSRNSTIQQVTQNLQDVAAKVKQTSLRTKFWVNFSSGEIQWMQSGCALNGPFIEVVSLDQYLVHFNATGYPWLQSHLNPGQQLALVPGTFVQNSGPGSDAAFQGTVLAEYFSFANTANQGCSNLNNCPLWMVLGFLLPDDSVFHGLSAAQTAPLQAAWQAQRSNPAIGDPSIIAIINQILED